MAAVIYPFNLLKASTDAPEPIEYVGGYGRRVAAAIANLSVVRSEHDWRARVGHYFIDKYRDRAVDSGYRAAAAQLRKQGVPLEIALLIFFNKEVRPN